MRHVAIDIYFVHMNIMGKKKPSNGEEEMKGEGRACWWVPSLQRFRF